MSSPAEGPLGLSAVLWEVLACPTDHAPVEADEQAGDIRCTKCGRHYPIRDGIPVMLPSSDPNT